VELSGAEFGVMGLPRGETLTITWASNLDAIPRVSVLLQRRGEANWPAPVYLAASIPNQNKFVWSNVGQDNEPPFEGGGQYFVTIWTNKQQYTSSANSPEFALADACAYVNCGTHGSCVQGQCVCANGFTGGLCATAPCLAGVDGCPCANGWTGPMCAQCSLTCLNSGVPNAECTRCTGCALGSYGRLCEFNYFRLGFRFLTDVSAWHGGIDPVTGEAKILNAAAAARWTQTLSTDVLSAVRLVSTANTTITVETIKPVATATAPSTPPVYDAVEVAVRLSVAKSSSSSSSAAFGRRLLAADASVSADLLATYNDLLPQLGDLNSALWSGAVTSLMDPSWAVTSEDPSGQATLASPTAPQDCFQNDCTPTPPPKDGASGDDGDIVHKILNTPLYLGLVIAGLALVAILIGVGVVFAVRRCRANKGSTIALKRLQGGNTTAGGFTASGESEMVQNPAVNAGSAWDRL
jgi:hypothetical protein